MIIYTLEPKFNNRKKKNQYICIKYLRLVERAWRNISFGFGGKQKRNTHTDAFVLHHTARRHTTLYHHIYILWIWLRIQHTNISVNFVMANDEFGVRQQPNRPPTHKFKN